MKKQLNQFIKCLAMMSAGFLVTPLSAHEISSESQKNLPWLGQMAGLHAQKVCAHRSGSNRTRCEAEQIKSLAETAASLPALRPANISPGEFAAMVEYHAGVRQHGAWANSSHAGNEVDCRINVC